MRKIKNTEKIVGALLIGVTVGGIVGAALGILFAPEKGKETRKNLLAKGGDFTGDIKDKLIAMVQEIKRETGSVKGRLAQVLGNGVTNIEESK